MSLMVLSRPPFVSARAMAASLPDDISRPLNRSSILYVALTDSPTALPSWLQAFLLGRILRSLSSFGISVSAVSAFSVLAGR